MKCKTRFNVMVGKRHAQPVVSFRVCVHTASAPPSRRRCQRKSQKESNNSLDTTCRTAQRGAAPARNRSDETSACTAVESLSGAHWMACVCEDPLNPTVRRVHRFSANQVAEPAIPRIVCYLRARSHGHSAAR